MDQERYLLRLQSLLWRQCSAARTAAVIGDYRECFREAAAEGRAESELIAELGTPEQISETLRDEKIGLVPLPYRRLEFWFTAALAVFLFAQCVSLHIGGYYLLPLSPLLISLVFLRPFLPASQIAAPLPRPKKRVYAVSLLCCASGCFFPVRTWLFLGEFLYPLPGANPPGLLFRLLPGHITDAPSAIGRLLFWAITLGMLASAAALLLCLCTHNKLFYYISAPLSALAFSCSAGAGAALRGLDVSALERFPALSQILWPKGVWLILAATVLGLVLLQRGVRRWIRR